MCGRESQVSCVVSELCQCTLLLVLVHLPGNHSLPVYAPLPSPTTHSHNPHTSTFPLSLLTPFLSPLTPSLTPHTFPLSPLTPSLSLLTPSLSPLTPSLSSLTPSLSPLSPLTGVPIVHLITYPFPRVWHTARDNADAIDKTFVSNFRKILAVFLHEYFHLR